jgi:hypothetical protein
MSSIDWIPAISTTTLFAILAWLCRNLIITRLTNSVEHEFNSRLETVRTDLRLTEERFRADLRAKDNDIALLRSGAMSAMTSRQMALDKRRLEAVDELWSAFSSLGSARALCEAMAYVNWEVASEKAQKDEKLRNSFEALGSGFDLKKVKFDDAHRSRPFLPPMVWAVYFAYMAICMHGVMRWNIARFGMDPKGLEGSDQKVNELVKVVLPDYAAWVDEHGARGYIHAVRALEEKLLRDMSMMMAGTESDKASIEQAAEIMRRSNAVLQETTPTAPPA